MNNPLAALFPSLFGLQAQGPGDADPVAKQRAELEAGRGMGNGTPGQIRKGPGGRNYQYAQTTGMAGATGDQGWIPTSMKPEPTGLSRLLDPSVALPMAAALMGNQGNAANLGNAFAMGGQGLQAQKADYEKKQKENQTFAWLEKNAPEFAEMARAGAPMGDVVGAYMQQRFTKPTRNEYQERQTAAEQYGLTGEDAKAFVLTGQLQAGGDDYAQRRLAAEQNGLSPDHPAYQSFILTGRMPREDQAPLTATDKKAILEADEMVAANESAIDALTKAEQLSGGANQGFLSGTRATIGNNLPDLAVPDWVSSPDSSIATSDMDNAVIGQALASMKTIFGGNPTEGERQILLQLQGSSNMPKPVRERVFARAKELAARRLAFNKQRAAELRGGTFYKQGGGAPQGGGASGQVPSAGGGNVTGTGVQWSIEP